jgi:hypothetical protein
MSTFYGHDLACPACGHLFRVELVRGIHITRLPWARAQILEGTFQAFRCPPCGEPITVSGSIVYTDFHLHHYVAVESAGRVTWQAAVLRHRSAFADSFDGGPPIAQEMGRRFTRRVVYGLPGLREKLMLWDAGLDDVVVEAVKGDLLAGLGLGPTEAVLRVAGVLEGGHVIFARFEPRPPPDRIDGQPLVTRGVKPVDFETAPRALYQRRAEDRGSITRDYPWLQDDWFVDIGDGAVHVYG